MHFGPTPDAFLEIAIGHLRDHVSILGNKCREPLERFCKVVAESKVGSEKSRFGSNFRQSSLVALRLDLEANQSRKLRSRANLGHLGSQSEQTWALGRVKKGYLW